MVTRDQRKEEMYICIVEQGYSIKLESFIGIHIWDVMLVEKILDKEYNG